MEFISRFNRNHYTFIQRMSVMFLIAFMLSSCATKPTPQQLAEADYGEYPTDYEEIVKNFANSYFKDPSSSQWNITSTPNQQWSSFFGSAHFGYGVCAEVNAKNSYGGYTGYKTHFFLINNGRVIQHIPEEGGDYDLKGAVAHKRCGG